MSDDNQNEFKNIILIVKIDSENLYYRVLNRKKEYIRAMGLRRSRKHLEEIFKSKYGEVSISDLKKFNADTIVNIEDFYNKISELRWYLDHTEEMPQTIEDSVDYKLKFITNIFESLSVYLEAELNNYN